MAIIRILTSISAIFCLVYPITFVHAESRDVVVEEFLTPLIKGKSELAFDRLSKSSAILHADKALLDSLKRDYTALSAQAGRLSGFEKISEEPIGTSLIRLKYLMRADKLPIIWNIVLYDGSADGSWQIIEMRCQSQVLEPAGSLAKSGL